MSPITMTDNILIVEDEPLIALMYSQTLQKHNYHVCKIISNGKDAVEEAGDTKPGVIIMDIVLEGDMDGIEAAKKIKEQYDIPVIFVTGNNDAKTRERALETAPLDYLVKPVDMEDVIQLLKNI